MPSQISIRLIVPACVSREVVRLITRAPAKTRHQQRIAQQQARQTMRRLAKRVQTVLVD